MKQKAQRFQHTDQEEPARKKQGTEEQQTQAEFRVNPEDTSQIRKGKSSFMTIQETQGFLEIPPFAHELAAILQFGTSYELVEWLAHKLQEVSRKNGTRT